MTEKTKILFIINPVSGVKHKKKQDLPNLIEGLFPKEAFMCNISYTEYAGHARALAAQAVEEKYDIVVAVGGDGSINDIARALKFTNTKLGIIPLGSGNGLSHFLKIPFQLKKALEVIKEGHVIKADTVTINHELFVSIAGLGFDASVAKHFAEGSSRGFFSYLKSVISLYFSYRPKKYHIVIDGQEIVERALMINFANSNQFGYKTAIAPQADITDGLVDITIIKKTPLFIIPIIIFKLFRGKIDKSKYVLTLKAREAFITRKKGKYLNLDGEPIKFEKEIQLKVNPASLQVIVPN